MTKKMNDPLQKKLKENRKRWVRQKLEQELTSLRSKGLHYKYGDADESKRLLHTVLSYDEKKAKIELEMETVDEARQLVLKTINKLEPNQLTSHIYLFHEESDITGALSMKVSECVMHMDELFDFIQYEDGRLMNSFMILEPNGRFAICLFHTEYGQELLYVNHQVIE